MGTPYDRSYWAPGAWEPSGVSLSLGGHAFKRSFTLEWQQRHQAWACAKGRATKWAPAAVNSGGEASLYNWTFPGRVPMQTLPQVPESKKRKTQKPRPPPPSLRSQEFQIQGKLSQSTVGTGGPRSVAGITAMGKLC